MQAVNTSSTAAMSNAAAQQSPTKPVKSAASMPKHAPALPAAAEASRAADGRGASRRSAKLPATEGASSGTTSPEHATPQQAQNPRPVRKAAAKQPTEAPQQGIPANCPEHAAPAEASKPQTEANVVAKLGEGREGAAFKPAPQKVTVSQPPSAASSRVSFQVQAAQ